MVEIMEVPKGFRKTEIGIIPDDWEQTPLNNISVSIASGKSKTQSQVGGKFPIYGSTGIIGFSSKYDYDGNRILIARVGANAGTVNYVEGSYCVSDNTLMVQLNENIDFTFILYFLKYFNLNKLIFGSGQPLITGTQLKYLPVPLPPSKAEQTAIAEALNDADALITGLEKLIAKKKAIKQGAMQELLKPKAGWEVKNIEDLTDCLDNLRVPLNETQRLTMKGDYPYCGANGILDFINDFRIDDEVILIAEDGGYFDEYATRPIAYKISGKFWVNNHAHILKAKINFDQDFIYYSLVHKNILNFLASGTRAKLNKAQMYKIEIQCPNKKSEQTHIAQILTDMDTEIDALEKKLDKYKMLKQGMMQNLLTGKIRLI